MRDLFDLLLGGTFTVLAFLLGVCWPITYFAAWIVGFDRLFPNDFSFIFVSHAVGLGLLAAAVRILKLGKSASWNMFGVFVAIVAIVDIVAIETSGISLF